VIEREGKFNKFLKYVEQITFSGKYASKIGQPVLYVTERAVFELEDGGLTLKEIAPGVDLERDILAHMEFTPRIAADLKLMPAELFCEKWGGLRQFVQSKSEAVINATTNEADTLVCAEQGA